MNHFAIILEQQREIHVSIWALTAVNSITLASAIVLILCRLKMDGTFHHLSTNERDK